MLYVLLNIKEAYNLLINFSSLKLNNILYNNINIIFNFQLY